MWACKMDRKARVLTRSVFRILYSWKFRQVLAPLLVFSVMTVIYFCHSRSACPDEKVPENSPGENVDFDKRIKIAIVTCTGSEGTEGKSATETLTLIKSVLISAKLYHVKEVGFLIFTDSGELENHMKNKIAEFNNLMGSHVNVLLSFHSAKKGLPSSTGNFFLKTSGIPCSYVRAFFPDSLPRWAKKVLYLDTDILVTGNIQHIWDSFSKVMHNEHLLAAMIPNNEPDDENYEKRDMDLFSRIPHVPPKGVNSGVMFMNVESMRNFNWTAKLLHIFGLYNQRLHFLKDQQVLNVLFFRDLDRLALFPCQFNFQHLHCDKGWTCKGAEGDLEGVQLVHGAGGAFEEGKEAVSHLALYKAFKNFDLRDIEKVLENLIAPVIQHYSQPLDASTCFGHLGPHLFKSLVAKNNGTEDPQ